MIAGHVIVKGTEEGIPFATVMILGTNRGAVSNEEGQFEFRKLAAGKYTLRVQVMGYKTQEKTITVSAEATSVVHFQMEEVSFTTDEVVVSANRNEVSRKAAPVVVNVMSAKLFETVTPRSVPSPTSLLSPKSKIVAACPAKRLTKPARNYIILTVPCGQPFFM